MKLSARQSIRKAKKLKGLTIANGSVYGVCLLTTYLDKFIVLFVAILSTVAATLALLKIADKEYFFLITKLNSCWYIFLQLENF